MDHNRLAKHRAFQDFRELHPGIPYDRSNRDHERFIDKQIKAHLDIMERHDRAKQYGRSKIWGS